MAARCKCLLVFFDRGVREASRQAGQHDVISHQLQQQRGDGIHQHLAGRDISPSIRSLYENPPLTQAPGTVMPLPQSFSNADLVDEEPFLVERSCVVPQWRCYAKFISCQQILLTFLPASFTGILFNVCLKPRSQGYGPSVWML